MLSVEAKRRRLGDVEWDFLVRVWSVFGVCFGAFQPSYHYQSTSSCTCHVGGSQSLQCPSPWVSRIAKPLPVEYSPTVYFVPWKSSCPLWIFPRHDKKIDHTQPPSRFFSSSPRGLLASSAPATAPPRAPSNGVLVFPEAEQQCAQASCPDLFNTGGVFWRVLQDFESRLLSLRSEPDFTAAICR